jgi:hypothetical protein
MRRVFVSSVVGEFGEFRAAARRAIELMGDRPIMCEDFGARPHSSEKACFSEVEAADVFILLLGERYGFTTPAGLSVTQSEFRAAQTVGKPILVFVQRTKMESEQEAFRVEVEDYQSGVFRAEYSSPEELKDEIVKGLQQLRQIMNAAPEKDFEQKINVLLKAASRFLSDDSPELNFIFWPQPARNIDIVRIENDLDRTFSQLCNGGLASMRDGYIPILEKDFTGIKSKQTKIIFFHNGLILVSLNPITEREGFFLSSYFAPPSRLTECARGIFQLIDFNGAWCSIQLRGMANVYVKELPPDGTAAHTMRGIWGGDEEAHCRERLIPITEKSFQIWADNCINRFRRIFAK